MVTSVLLPLGLAVVMVSLGLALTVADFQRILVAPRGVVIGLANLLVLSPLLAFGVAKGWGLTATLAVGLVILGASPGGTMANLLTHLARGDTALSVTMSALSSLAAVVTVPAFLGLAIAVFDADGLGEDVSMPGIVARVFLITLLPLGLGMRIRARRPDLAERVAGGLRTAALAAFVLIVVAAVLSELDTLREHFVEVAGAALTLNVLAMTCSYAIARASRLDRRQATAIAMELGVHNSTLAIAVATVFSDELAVPAAVYSAFMFITAGSFARLMYRRNAVSALLDAAR
jgi:BASS family bile acid:Na+ symporter